MQQLARLIASPQLFLKHRCLGGSQVGNHTLEVAELGVTECGNAQHRIRKRGMERRDGSVE